MKRAVKVTRQARNATTDVVREVEGVVPLENRKEATPLQTQVSQSQAAPPSTLVSAKIFEVVAPPPITSIKGALVPRILVGKRRRKVSIEVHQIDNDPNAKKKTNGESNSYQECIVRILNPANKRVRDESAKKRREKRRVRNEEDDEQNLVDEDDDADDDDASTVAHPAMMDSMTSNFAKPEGLFEGWEERYRFPLRYITIKGTLRTGVFVQITLGRAKQTRQLIFDTMDEAEEFRDYLAMELEREQERNDAKLKVVFHGQKPPEKKEITFLLEVVSGWDLPVGDLQTSDPYVIVSFLGQDIHKTAVIEKTLDPIWTVKTGSLFLFKIDAESLYLSEGLLLTVKDFDALGGHERLGIVYVAPKDIYEGKGERMEYKLLPPPGSKKKMVPGYMAVRCRRASDSDIQFMEENVYVKTKSQVHKGVDPATEQAGSVGALTSFLTRQRRTIKWGDREVHEYKMRPGPDPKRVEETTWMTDKLIQEETVKDSHHWMDVGSGRLGRLFVEVLGCDNLPNLDFGGRNKTDAFVAMVYEDAFIMTDVVSDCLNPRWLPWMKRAGIFHIFHSSSQLFLGVFDNDDSFNPAQDHDMIGRVAVDLTNLRRDTMYVLKYDLYTTGKLSTRQKHGTLTVRLRMEIDDDRAVLLSNLEPPPEFYVNTKTRKDFRVVRFTCSGKHDTTKYNINYINSYIEEILALQHIIFHLQDGATRLFLWRGTLPVTLFGKSFFVPIHSLSLFLSLAIVVEKPQWIPSFAFASMGWGMLATLDYRSHLPSPWLRVKAVFEHLVTLVTGSSPVPAHSIAAGENEEATLAFQSQWEKRIQDAEAAAAKEYEENMREQQQLEKEMEELGDVQTDISTKTTSRVTVDPFKGVLYPVQQNLQMAVKYLRHARFIASWQENYIAFWLTFGCFVLSFLCLFVPWFFLLKWSSRFFVWVILGPWTGKALDILYVQKWEAKTEEDKEREHIKALERRRLATASTITQTRIRKENAMKLQAMKKYMFGRYIARVPVLKEDRYIETPLPDSSATPYEPEPLPMSEIAMQEAGYRRTRLPGQHLVGAMIPRIETVSFTEAPIGQAIRRPKLVNKKEGAGRLLSDPDSTAGAYVKIGSLFVAASVISWFAVPFFSTLTEQLLLALQSQTS